MSAATLSELQLRFELQELYGAYAACLDDGNFDEWPNFFTEECRYRLVPRENFEQNLPLSTIDLRSRGALFDRVYAAKSTLYHAPYYQAHLIGPPTILEQSATTVRVQASYAVFRTKRDTPSEVFNVGRYRDTIVRTADGMRFAEKICIFDSELISNSIIYPI